MIVTGCFNTTPYDRTRWYSTPEGCVIDSAELRNEIPQNCGTYTSSNQVLTNSHATHVAKDADAPVAIADCPHSEILKLFAQHLPMARQPAEWNAQRQALLRARWREKSNRQNIDWWSRLFVYVAKSEFLLDRAMPLTEADFHHPSHAEIFKAIAGLHARRQPADMITVHNSMGEMAGVVGASLGWPAWSCYAVLMMTGGHIWHTEPAWTAAGGPPPDTESRPMPLIRPALASVSILLLAGSAIWPEHIVLTGALGEVVCGVLGLYVGGRVHLKGG